MSEEKKQINMSIQDGADFFAHETSINFNPTQFVLDFRSITPRIDPRTKETPVVVLRHNVVLIDPWHAKEMLRVITDVIKKYEAQFGKIEQPKAMKKYLKQAKEKQKDEEDKVPAPHYMG